MSLTQKDENNIDGLSISSFYGEEDVNEDFFIKNTYANMYIAKNDKIISVFLYYNKKDEIINVNIRVLATNDNEARTSEILNMAEYLRQKRGLKIESKKIGRNELCPCGSGKKYKHCHGK